MISGALALRMTKRNLPVLRGLPCGASVGAHAPRSQQSQGCTSKAIAADPGGALIDRKRLTEGLLEAPCLMSPKVGAALCPPFTRL